MGWIRRASPKLAVVVVVVVSGVGGVACAPGASPREDGGAASDGGPPPVDAGREDAGRLDDGGAPDAGVDAGPPRSHGLEVREINLTCALDGAPPLAVPALATEALLPAASTPQTIALAPGASVDEVLLVEQGGLVRAFAPFAAGQAAAAQVLDLRDRVRCCAGAPGLVDVAYLPSGGAAVAAYVAASDPLRLVVSRFPAAPSGALDAAGEQVLLEVPLVDASRAGGHLLFGVDDMLYVAIGDGGAPDLAADPASLAGKVLRVDVDGPAGLVPADNPFTGVPGARGEVWALGLGAPSGCAVDSVVGKIWCVDAGGDALDEVHVVAAGADLGWPRLEGAACRDGAVECRAEAAAPPVASFPRDGGCAASGALVARDPDLPEANGLFLFGSGCAGEVRALRFDGRTVRALDVATSLPARATGLCEGPGRAVLLVDEQGALHRLARPAGAPAPTFPTTLSATGCFSDVPSRTPAPGLVPYEVRAPLWSDGAEKRRFLVLPGTSTIELTAQGAWALPDGAILVKEFLLDDDEDAATPAVPLETRFFVKRSAQVWEGYSFMWDRARREAFLLDGAELSATPVDAAGGPSTHVHVFPSRAECLLCHNQAAGRTLGLQTAQMNADHDYDGFVENQLSAMAHVGLFSEPLPAPPDDLPRLPDPRDETAAQEQRARAVLHANCSHCHRPGGPAIVDIDLRYETPLSQTKTCDVAPRFDVGVAGAKIIAPGSASTSAVFLRMSTRGRQQMPPLGTRLRDETSEAVVRDWIDGLAACP